MHFILHCIFECAFINISKYEVYITVFENPVKRQKTNHGSAALNESKGFACL